MATPEVVAEKRELAGINADYKEKFGFHDSESGYAYKAPKGLSREIVESISEYKDEPQWMRDFRLKALEHFYARPTPTWGGNLGQIDFDDIHYFVRASEKNSRDWSEVPEDIKNTFDRLGIPEAERKFLSGVGAQYESEVVYHQVNEKLEAQGVIFTDMDTALREHEDLVREHWATIIPPNDNKLAALNSAVWSGGSFVYVPAGVKVEMPLQAYFRINTENMGQFERTLIICEEGADVHYIEGCTAPVYSSDSLHSAVVEIVAKKSSRVRYTTVQNWSQNVFNLVTKRAVAHEKATMEWVDCNLGSKLTMKYPSIYLLGPEAHGEILSIAFAGEGQHQDAGGKIIHAAPRTSSSIFSKSISKDGGRATYRGLLEVADGATESRSKVVCDALLLDEDSRSDTYPTIRIDENDADVGHEATVSKIGDEQLFYLQSRGLSEEEASKMIVNGFIEPVTKELPMEYAVELNRLIELQMEGSHWLRSRPNRLGFPRGARGAPLSRESCRCPTRRRRAGNSPTSRGWRSTPTRRARRVPRSRRREGATVLPLSEALESHGELLHERLGSLVPIEDPFVARNEAAWRDGVLVHVPRGRQARASRSGSRCPSRRPAPRSAGAPWSCSRRAPRPRSGSTAPPPATRSTRCSTRWSSWRSARRRRCATSAPRTSPSPPGSSPPSGPRWSATGGSTGPRSASARRAARCGWRRSWPDRAPRRGSPAAMRAAPGSTSTTTRRRSTRRRTPTPTSPSAASSPPARPPSGAG